MKCACVSSSSYYYAKKHAGDRKDKDKDLVRIIKGLQEGGNWKYGSRPMTILVNRVTSGTYGRRRIARIMSEYNLQSRIRRRKHSKRYYQKKKLAMQQLPDNVLDRDFNAEKPLQKLVTDITYIPIKRGWCYFGPVLDLYNREIVAYVIFLSIQLDLSQKLLDGLEALELEPGVLLHSDRGSSYTATAYRNRLVQMGITQSMSRPGNCWDNACIERFFGHMKDELGIMKNGKMKLVDYARMEQMIMNWVEEYNTVRPHSVLHGMSPIEYRMRMMYHNDYRVQ